MPGVTLTDILPSLEPEQILSPDLEELNRNTFEQPDYLSGLNDAEHDAIASLRQDRYQDLILPQYQKFIDQLPKWHKLNVESINLDSDWLRIGEANNRPPELSEMIEAFAPWKKGPFEIFGEKIDAEWRSDLKWNRIKSVIGSLKGKTIADIGCHNGYFMFRMAAESPKLVVGFEPYAKHWFHFQALQNLIKNPALFFELLGVEHTHLYKNTFDYVFCLGILYHHTDPVSLIRKMSTSIKSKGYLVLENQGIPGELPLTLVPKGRYCGAKGIWNLPTASCVENWLQRCGFIKIKTFYNEALSTEEQRSTDYADIKSLKDFLDPSDRSKTIEGYPAPHRIYTIAQKP